VLRDIGKQGDYKEAKFEVRKAYPVILAPDDFGYLVTIPDFDCNTQGRNLPEAIEMARDALGAWATAESDCGRSVPEPSTVAANPAANEILTFVDIDFDEYRASVDMTSERTNVTLPRYLKRKAEAVGLNFSQELQARLLERLHI